MMELDEATIRAHVRRRAGDALAQARVDSLTRSIMTRLDEEARSLPRLVTTVPIGARVTLAAALIVAFCLIALPLTGGPRSSNAPSTGAATEGATAASTPDPNELQILSLAELQQVLARGDEAPGRDHIVVADVDLAPNSTPPPCVFVVEEPPSIVDPGNPCWVDGSVVGANPPIHVMQPTEDTDILRATIGDAGIIGPVILRIRGTNTVELIGDAPRSVGNVAWSLGTFVKAVHRFPQTLEFNPNKFVVGPPYVVQAQLVQGDVFFCPLQTPTSNRRLAEFSCGATAWLAPTDVTDPSGIVDGWTSRPPDWVRVQNDASARFGATLGPGASGASARRGFYLVFPLIAFNRNACFDCGGGAVAILYEALAPVPIP
jgi:hypothetical protein